MDGWLGLGEGGPQIGSFGASQSWATDGRAAMLTWARGATTRSSCTARPSASKAADRAGIAERAVSVRCRPWARRTKRGHASHSSSDLTWCETAAGVTPSSSAARAKLSCRAAASNVRRAVSGGRRGRGGLTAIEQALSVLLSAGNDKEPARCTLVRSARGCGRADPEPEQADVRTDDALPNRDSPR